MRLGIFAKTFPGDIEANMAAVAAAGLGAVQYNLSIAGLETVPEEVPEEAVRRIARAAEEHGVELAAISGTFNTAHPDPAVRERGLSRFPVLARTAAALGIPTVTLSSGSRHPSDMWHVHPDNATAEAWRDSVESLARIAAIAEETGITAAFEPENANVAANADLARAMLDAVGSGSLKIVFDAANLMDSPDVVAADVVAHALDVLGEDIVLAHAKELTADAVPAAPGEGVLPWEDIVRELQGAGYDGPLVIHGLPAESVARAVATLGPLVDGGP